jgi:hypothetical protein
MGHFWLVAALAVAIWLITAAARRAKANAKERVVEPNQGRPPRRRPSSADIDRFLDEVKRRQAEQRRRQTEPPAVEPVVIVEGAAKLVPPPVRRPPPRRLQAEPVLVAEAIPVALPVPPPQRVAEAPPLPAPESTAAKRPAYLDELLRLLRSPQGLRAAILVNEFLGPPLCKRRARR